MTPHVGTTGWACHSFDRSGNLGAECHKAARMTSVAIKPVPVVDGTWSVFCRS